MVQVCPVGPGLDLILTRDVPRRFDWDTDTRCPQTWSINLLVFKCVCDNISVLIGHVSTDHFHKHKCVPQLDDGTSPEQTVLTEESVTAGGRQQNQSDAPQVNENVSMVLILMGTLGNWFVILCCHPALLKGTVHPKTTSPPSC